MEPAKLIVEVVAGVIPETPEPEFTKRWGITSAEWERAAEEGTGTELMAERTGQAQGYAHLLMLQPERFNWVRIDWL
jgi:hypothetical protein